MKYSIGDKIRFNILSEFPEEIWTGTIKSINEKSEYPYRVIADWLNGEESLFLVKEKEVIGYADKENS